MLDPKRLRNELQRLAYLLLQRGYVLDTATVKSLEDKRRLLQSKTQELQHHRNKHSKEIGQAKSQGQDIQPLLDQVASLGDELRHNEEQLNEIQQQLQEIVVGIPNTPHESVPDGKTEQDNQVLRSWGDIPEFNFPPRDHVELGVDLQLLDFDAATKISSARFVIMQGMIAKLHRALAQFMLDLHTNEHGYQEINVPFIVNATSMFGTGQLPKFKADLFSIKNNSSDGAECQEKDEMFLIPTGEVPVTNILRDTILNSDQLPRKYVCHTACFRSEAGSYGKDTRGMIRQHQFEKVEMVQLVKAENSYQVLEELTGHVEKVLQLLKIPYRVVSLCAGDLGFSAAKTYDLEVWLPGQQQYREISSCSNFEDFQARRIQARWRDPKSGKIELLHTLNGSGLAVGRALVAVLENYQDAQGQINIPEVLIPYMHGHTVITHGSSA